MTRELKKCVLYTHMYLILRSRVFYYYNVHVGYPSHILSLECFMGHALLATPSSAVINTCRCTSLHDVLFISTFYTQWQKQYRHRYAVSCTLTSYAICINALQSPEYLKPRMISLSRPLSLKVSEVLMHYTQLLA